MSEAQRYKADAGKTQPDLLQVGMARALRVVQATTDYGAIKYEEHSWRKVPEGMKRYLKGAERHRQERHLLDLGDDQKILGAIDAESGLPHIAHEIFCLLCLLELAIAESEVSLEEICEFKDPPLNHKK